MHFLYNRGVSKLFWNHSLLQEDAKDTEVKTVRGYKLADDLLLTSE